MHDPRQGRQWPADQPGALADRDLLIFDFDGTVADTTPLHAQAFAEVLAPHGVSVHYPDIAGLRTQDAIARCLAGSSVAAEHALVTQLTHRKQERVRALIASSIQPMPGVSGFLDWAQGRWPVALATSGSLGTVSLALRALGWSERFAPMVFADDVSRAKPAPDLFIEVLRRAGVPPERALVFEDAPSGLAAARAAGIDHVDVRHIDWSIWHKERP